MKICAAITGTLIAFLVTGLFAQENPNATPSRIANSVPKAEVTTAAPAGTTVTDIDGNVYKTVTIGNQVWMAENLKTTRYRNGDLVGTTSPATLDISSESTPKYQWAYAGDESNVATYGRLYTWYAVTDSRNIAPAGWHVPMVAEWRVLINFLGGASLAHGKLKETGTMHWKIPDSDATNESGFTGLPGGSHWTTVFKDIGECGHYWSATEREAEGAWRLLLDKAFNEYPFLNSSGKKVGWSVRCLRDAPALPSASLAAQENTKPTNNYLGQTPPGDIPVVFARGIVSTDHLEHSAPAFSPDGNEVFWSLWRRPEMGERQVIMTMRREGGTWSVPAVAPFSGKYLDGGPAFSVDGRRIYFYSTRPTPAGTMSDDIWFVEKQGKGWGEPQCLGFVARFPELKAVYQPSITRNGTLYFISRQKDMPPNEFLIYRAELINGEYPKPELLPQSINAPDAYVNWTPFIAPDESYLLFSSDRRNHHGGGDLYIARRAPDGTWSQPEILPDSINTPEQERFPSISPDGQYLFFTRPTPGHDQDVCWVSAASISALRAQPNSSPEIK